MSRKQWIQLGRIGVDAGLVWVGDPCYIHKEEGEDLPREWGKDWRAFLNNLWSKDGRIPAANAQAVPFRYDAGHYGLGVCVCTDDGVYPVLGRFAGDGRLAEVRIVLDGSVELEVEPEGDGVSTKERMTLRHEEMLQQLEASEALIEETIELFLPRITVRRLQMYLEAKHPADLAVRMNPPQPVTNADVRRVVDMIAEVEGRTSIEVVLDLMKLPVPLEPHPHARGLEGSAMSEEQRAYLERIGEWQESSGKSRLMIGGGPEKKG